MLNTWMENMSTHVDNKWRLHIKYKCGFVKIFLDLVDERTRMVNLIVVFDENLNTRNFSEGWEYCFIDSPPGSVITLEDILTDCSPLMDYRLAKDYKGERWWWKRAFERLHEKNRVNDPEAVPWYMNRYYTYSMEGVPISQEPPNHPMTPGRLIMPSF